MKHKIILLILMVLLQQTLFTIEMPKIMNDGERKRVFILAGTGYAFSRVQGLSAELGLELRLFGRIYARLLVDYNTASSGLENDGITIDNALGLNLTAIYKLDLTETLNFNIMAGGNYTSYNEKVDAFGVNYSSSESIMGINAGAGVDLQINNKWGLYLEATLKYIMSDLPWTWIKSQMGIRFRIK
jgi:Outer membrane protein beta-barrel domain